MRLSSGTRSLVAVLGIIFLAVFGWMYVQANQTERAFVYARDIPPFEFIEKADGNIRAITIPSNRDFEAITDAEQIVGKYVGANGVEADALVQNNQLITDLPSGRRSFPRGLLPLGTKAYVLDIPENIAGVFAEGDFIDLIAVVDEDNIPSPDDSAYLIFQKVQTLGIVEEKFLVALTFEQIAAYEGWKNIPNIEFRAAINQDANGDFPPLFQAPLFVDDENLGNVYSRPTPTPELLPEPATDANAESQE